MGEEPMDMALAPGMMPLEAFTIPHSDYLHPFPSIHSLLQSFQREQSHGCRSAPPFDPRLMPQSGYPTIGLSHAPEPIDALPHAASVGPDEHNPRVQWGNEPNVGGDPRP